MIVALFQPVRRRKSLEAFSATLRQEVDLSALTGQLVEVVTETMSLRHVSLWLRNTTKERDQQR